ncbi:hypothetical protein AVEN_81098-1 [Araneus ventricosus]|uniref:Uncharacterized protein n=1 Tax=Araneus ventricosus TaxID=182803 RepID=A0A4Y2DTE3_ARAVE|nr:hypothetical protein AVEN_81098-1 [Araneus ventricosus]
MVRFRFRNPFFSSNSSVSFSVRRRVSHGESFGEAIRRLWRENSHLFGKPEEPSSMRLFDLFTESEKKKSKSAKEGKLTLERLFILSSSGRALSGHLNKKQRISDSKSN